MDNVKFREELQKLISWNDKYCNNYDEFKSFPIKVQQVIYFTKFIQEDNVNIWLSRLEKPGFTFKAGVTPIYYPLITNYNYESVVSECLRQVRRSLLEQLEQTAQGAQNSTPKQGKTGFVFPPE